MSPRHVRNLVNPGETSCKNGVLIHNPVAESKQEGKKLLSEKPQDSMTLHSRYHYVSEDRKKELQVRLSNSKQPFLTNEAAFLQ